MEHWNCRGKTATHTCLRTAIIDEAACAISSSAHSKSPLCNSFNHSAHQFTIDFLHVPGLCTIMACFGIQALSRNFMDVGCKKLWIYWYENILHMHIYIYLMHGMVCLRLDFSTHGCSMFKAKMHFLAVLPPNFIMACISGPAMESKACLTKWLPCFSNVFLNAVCTVASWRTLQAPFFQGVSHQGISKSSEHT